MIDCTVRALLLDLRKVTAAREAAKIRETGRSWSLTDQICHTHSEVTEIYEGQRHEHGRHKIVLEICDAVFSAITIGHLYGLSDEELLDGMMSTLKKVQLRAGLSPCPEPRQ